MDRKAVSPVIAIVLLLMMTVAAAGAAYFWLTSMQSSMQESSRKSIENIMEASGRRVVAQGTLCKPTYPYKGLISYWKMDGSGSYANDSSGYGHDGILEDANTSNADGDTPPQWTDGKAGTALEFDGTDDYVEINDNTEYSKKWNTWTAWVYQEDYSGHWDTWFRASCYQIAVHLRNIKLFSCFGSNNEGWAGENIPTEEDGTWKYLTYVVNNKTNKVKFYIDGEPAGGASIQEDQCGVPTTSRYIGTWDPDSGQRWGGRIDEVRIYNRVLSQSAIEALYEAGKDKGRREVDITVRNIGSEEIPKATWVANLKHDGTNVETDAYNASSIGTGELKTLKFYFKNFKPNTEYTIELQGTGTSTTVSC